MAKRSSADGRTRSSVQIFVVGLCCLFYMLWAWKRNGFGKGDSIALEITRKDADCNIVPNLSFDSHHVREVSKIDEFDLKPKVFKPCTARYTDYMPFLDQRCAMTFHRENMNYRERGTVPEGR
ncbi:hypothetical protein RJT34_02279 [Clitoria ternatea]|uniref:Uncharacterized protein n=1 Tax=Clitoria ternatea TaxID=43366 RepID=A0AAN9KIY0_CLITE